MILALDTSTAIASIALYDGSVSGEITWRSGRNHSVELMEQVQGLMKLRRVEPEQLTAVAVAVGPGSYTGLRVGLAAGKGLCVALGIPMVGVITLDILAEAQAASCLPVRPLLDAGRHRFATALYRQKEGELRRAGPIEGKSVEEILAGIDEETLLCGDVGELLSLGVETPLLAGGRQEGSGQLSQASATVLPIDQGVLIRVAGQAASLRRAGYLAEIGWKRYHRGEAQDARQIDAVYLGKEEK